MKKKLLCVLLTCTMVLCLGACGSTSENSDSGEKTEEVSEEKSEEESEETGKLENASIEEQVLCDQDGVKVTATGLDGANLEVTVENNTDKKIGVLPNRLAVNHCTMYLYDDMMLHPGMGYIECAEDDSFAEISGEYGAVVAEAGETMEGKLTVYYEDVHEMECIGLVDLSLYIYDGESYEKLFQTELTEIKTSAYDKMDEIEQPEGTEICNKEGILMIITNLEETESGNYDLELYVDNQSGKDINLVFPYAETEEEAQDYNNGGTTIANGNILTDTKAFIKTNMSKEVSLYTDNGMEDKERENVIINISETYNASNGYSFITCTDAVAIADLK